MATRLSLRVHRVKCQDETGGKWVEKFGNDEIYLGGFAVQPNGDTTPISPSAIYPHFDDGDVKVFNPPRVFYTFTGLQAFPKEFGIGLVLIEKDQGGSEDAVKKIATKAQELIKAKLAVAGGLLGVAISLVIGPLLTFITDRIVAGVRDDLFPAQIVTVPLPSQNFTWSGSNNSAEKTIRIVGHGGIYELTYDWEFI
jgi:hypothetical protein